jgi:hypothetical protein
MRGRLRLPVHDKETAAALRHGVVEFEDQVVVELAARLGQGHQTRNVELRSLRRCRIWYEYGTPANDVHPWLRTASQNTEVMSPSFVSTMLAPAIKWVFRTESP